MKRFYSLLLGFGFIASSMAQTLDAGKQLYLKGEYANAKPIFEKYIKQRPNDASLNHWLGVCYFETGEQNKAEKYLKAASKRNIQESYRYLAELYNNEYRFEEAEKAIDTYLAFKRLSKEQIEKGTILSERAGSGRRHLDAIDDVVFIDSISVDKNQFLQSLNISREAGSITPFTSFFNKPADFPSAVYMNEKKDRIFFGDVSDSTRLDLFYSARNGDSFTERQPLSGAINSPGNEVNPFVLSDGLTVYFASDRPESIGGYDIFVTSYNLGSEEYMRPENAGFPYNSPANEYMLAIDEMNNIGWLVTDRNQPGDKVAVYAFIYSDSRNNLREEDEEIKRSRAALRSYKDSWKEGTDYTSWISKARNVQTATQSEREFFFILNNSKQYTKFSDFRNKQSAELYKQVISLRNNLAANQEKLSGLRKEYSKQNEGNKKRLSPAILKLEQENESILAQTDKLEARIRELELKN
ncbi:MAG: tetratricopeptide repeat protein [Bacteroidales bacterium]